MRTPLIEPVQVSTWAACEAQPEPTVEKSASTFRLHFALLKPFGRSCIHLAPGLEDQLPLRLWRDL
jgi:hypothetical protein